MAKEKKTPLKAFKKAEKDPLNDLIIETIQDKKGSNITLIDLRDVDGPTDYFIICEAENITLTKAIADYIYQAVKDKMGYAPNHIEGVSQAKWILVDYFTTIVHIFYKETRKYYELESLWSDARTVEFHQV
ncbi:MAG: ribosome silencing factor [Saprospiraceae bacterium]|nr:ribosome silencing factor [Saprospiraceae bacterium]MBK6477129.1 ribosome silencing factor [Saprospiraceae bacterium]MBK6814571.1 ribosome silencing factor [Saprospiraceae bacterium]MBK7369958.1 ribosome silencing factor [Saprospiraceae bacterium]MBK7437661.1 ribosome silencing factor [Saprospiraceae bacterium]